MSVITEVQKEIVSRSLAQGLSMVDILQPFGYFPTLDDLIERNLITFIRAYHYQTYDTVIVTEHLGNNRLAGKLCISGKEPLEVEIHYGLISTHNRYSELKALGCPVPKFLEGWFLWQSHVTITERLYDVHVPCNIEYMVETLLTQLEYVHRFKDFPDYSVNKFGQSKQGAYFLNNMDMIGQATKKENLMAFARHMASLDKNYSWLVEKTQRLNQVTDNTYKTLLNKSLVKEPKEEDAVMPLKNRHCCLLQ